MSTTKAERLMGIREGGWTDRMHTVPKLRRYGVDGHSWGVAVLARFLFEDDCDVDLLTACLMHDVPERWVGDTPHPAKYRMNPALGKELKKTEAIIEEVLEISVPGLTPRQMLVLGFCDILELVLWAREEVNMGNRLMSPTFEHGCSAMFSHPLWSEVADVVRDMLETPFSENTSWWQEIMK